MQKQRVRRYVQVGVLVFALFGGGTHVASADTSRSTHYMVDETQIGAGASLHDCSTNYCSKVSVGDLTVGSASSANYSAQFGFNTTDVPLLEVIVTGGTQDLGVLDTSHTATATSTVKVRNYLSQGYAIEMSGTPPSQGEHTLTAMSTDCPCTSQPGAEQFGMNLWANTAPSVGAEPVQVPSSDFSFGYVTDDYDTPNLFKYTDGAIVARSDKSSGETDYTLSMILNISNVTPGGRYTGNFSAVVVPTY